MLKLVGIVPHPPIIIPAIGRGDLDKAAKTVAGMQALSSRVKEARPELIILITPHGQVLREGPAVLASEFLEGSFAQFGFPQIRITFKTDLKLLELLQQETEDDPIKPAFLKKTGNLSHGGVELDHGAMVPLYYLKEAGLYLPGLHLTFGFNSYRELYHFGQSLRRAADRRGLPYAVLASGDLSHRLMPGAPAGYSRRGAEFDQKLVEYLAGTEVEKILKFDQQLVEEAGECGLRSFIIALGMLDGNPFKSDIISYEGPFGVGYLVALLEPDRAEEFNPTKLARSTLERYFKQGKTPAPPDRLPPQLTQKAGAFVSLKKEGMLRGCIGTIEPVHNNLAEEISANAINAAFRDPRFPPLTEAELATLDISVDILSPLEKVESKAELNPKQYGVLVRSGPLSGLLLPDLEGVESVDEQVAIASRKAGIGPGQAVELFRFTVTRYREE
jgi:MEMO1 family protein